MRRRSELALDRVQYSADGGGVMLVGQHPEKQGVNLLLLGYKPEDQPRPGVLLRQAPIVCDAPHLGNQARVKTERGSLCHAHKIWCLCLHRLHHDTRHLTCPQQSTKIFRSNPFSAFNLPRPHRFLTKKRVETLAGNRCSGYIC